MSRNRLSELQSPAAGYTNEDGYQQNQNNHDLERNDLVAGERYELQDRSARQLSLNEFLEEVLRDSSALTKD